MRQKKVFSVLVIALSVFVTSTSQAQLSLEVVIDSGLSTPLFVCQPPGDSDRLFIMQQGGVIRILENGALLPTPFLDISSQVLSGGERGLLGMAFHPDYETNGHFFVNYTSNTNGGDTTISRFTVSADPDVADAASEVVFLSIDQPAGNHNAGMLDFSPIDGYLYICTGDGGNGNDTGTGHSPEGNAQDPQKLLGKILRIDVDQLPGNTIVGNYAIPADNPFISDGGVADEIWALGLRNPYRYSFDSATGDLYIGDVGQNAQEEISYQPATSTGGENYGWRIFEGTRCNTTVETQAACDALTEHVPPVHTYANPTEGRAVIGGYVYRGNAIPSIQGRYFFSDANAGRVWSFLLDGGAATDVQEHTSELDSAATPLGSPASFGVDNANNLYVVNRFGRIYRLLGPAGPVENGVVIGPGRIEIGDELNLSADIPGLVGNTTFQWIKDGADIPGAIDPTYTVPFVTAGDEGFYQARVTDESKAIFLTEPFFVEVLATGALPIHGGGMLVVVVLITAGAITARRRH